jgi:hypothetical protein
MTDPTVGRIVGWLDEEMRELSRLHMAYENAEGIQRQSRYEASPNCRRLSENSSSPADTRAGYERDVGGGVMRIRRCRVQPPGDRPSIQHRLRAALRQFNRLLDESAKLCAQTPNARARRLAEKIMDDAEPQTRELGRR